MVCFYRSTAKSEVDKVHSRRLIPALKALINEEENEDTVFAVEHLKSYPEIDSRMKQFQKLKSKWVKLQSGELALEKLKKELNARGKKVSQIEIRIAKQLKGNNWISKMVHREVVWSDLLKAFSTEGFAEQEMMG